MPARIKSIRWRNSDSPRQTRAAQPKMICSSAGATALIGRSLLNERRAEAFTDYSVESA